MTPVDGTRQSQPCDVPVPDHAPGNARLYPCGWRCTTHAPRPGDARQRPTSLTL